MNKIGNLYLVWAPLNSGFKLLSSKVFRMISDKMYFLLRVHTANIPRTRLDSGRSYCNETIYGLVEVIVLLILVELLDTNKF